MENRRHPRLGDINSLVDISDGRGFFSGYIQNISRFGLCLQDISGKFDQNVRRLSIVITNRETNFKMSARIRWTENTGYTKNLGLELINAPWSWTEFVMQKEPEPDYAEDPWIDVFIS